MHRLARPLGITYLLLATHAAIEAVMVMSELLRMIPHQFAFQILVMLVPRHSEAGLLFIHVAAVASLATALRLWDIQHRRTRLAMAITAGIHGLLAPFGLLVTAALVWLLRHPEFTVDAPLAPVAGRTRSWMVLTWTATSIATWIIALGAFMLIGVAPLLWFGALLLVPIPQVGLAMWMLRRPLHRVAGMPELPTIQGQA